MKVFVVQQWLRPPFGVPIGHFDLSKAVPVYRVCCENVRINSPDTPNEGWMCGLVSVWVEAENIDAVQGVDSVLYALSFAISHLQANIEPWSWRVWSTENSREFIFALGAYPGILPGRIRVTNWPQAFLVPFMTRKDWHSMDAILWYSAGINAVSLREEYLCYWAGLESLVSDEVGHRLCNHCRNPVELCPACKKRLSKTPQARQPLYRLFEPIGIPRKDVDRMYSQRSAFVHGGAFQADENIGEDINRIRAALWSCICFHSGEDKGEGANWYSAASKFGSASISGPPFFKGRAEEPIDFHQPSLLPDVRAVLTDEVAHRVKTDMDSQSKS